MKANAILIGIDPGLATTRTPGGIDASEPVAVTDEAYQAKAAEVTKQLQSTISVAYSIEDGRDIRDMATFSGGEQIGSCTAGFAARRNSIYGIITAGHCGNDGPTETSSFSMHGITLEHLSGWAYVRADAQFHTIPTGASHNLRGGYLCSAASVPPSQRWCDVTGTVARSRMVSRHRLMSDHVCHTGKRSGISCGTIQSINYRPTNSGACVSFNGAVVRCQAVFVKVEGRTLRTCEGDSGGPWYRNGVAYGITKSAHLPSCSNRVGFSVFSAIDEVENFLKLEVLTSTIRID